MIVLGLNIFHADTSAALIANEKIIVAIEEERFTKIKHYSGLPINAIEHCLNSSNINISEVDIIAVNYKSKYNFFQKILFSLKNINFSTFNKIIALKKKNNVKNILEEILNKKISAKIVHVPHHIAHISSSYFISGLDDAIGLTVDGSGDFSTSESFILENSSVKGIEKVFYPHSLGIFYQTFTQYLGFQNYGDEYKMMGLSSYGEPKYTNRVKKVISYDKNGNFKLNLEYFNHHKNMMSFNSDEGLPVFSNFFNSKFIELFGNQRFLINKITEYHKDLASSVQKIFEEIIILKILHLHKKYAKKNLVLSGGCFFNSILNGKIHDLELFDNISISPFPGDMGGGLGAALYLIKDREHFKNRPLETPYLGTNYSNDYIEKEVIKEKNLENSDTVNFEYYKNFSEITSLIAKKIFENKLVAWFQDKSEFGPRALGNRSLFANPINKKIKEIINEKIKKRENFRPFAPVVLEENYKDYFYQKFPSPYMEFVFKAKDKAKNEIPGVVHVDGTSRVQTVNKNQNHKLYGLLIEFKKLTNVPVLLNTSLNINEPINNDPLTAFETFTKSNIDILVMQNYVFTKK